MDAGFLIYQKPKNNCVKALSEQRERAFTQLYECPSAVDEQQLKDLHINVYDAEE